MQKAFVLLLLLFFISGCWNMKYETLTKKVTADADSQIILFGDGDLTFVDGKIKKVDDTLLLIYSISNLTNANPIDDFNKAMIQVEKMYKTRGEVYKAWLQNPKKK